SHHVSDLLSSCFWRTTYSTGTPSSNTSGSTLGASGAYTLDGPPLRMIPTGFQARSLSFWVQGSISEYTPRDLSRLKMSFGFVLVLVTRLARVVSGQNEHDWSGILDPRRARSRRQ